MAADLELPRMLRPAFLVAGLLRKDVRAVAPVRPQKVPMVFRRPIAVVGERPLFESRVVRAVQLVMEELLQPGAVTPVSPKSQRAPPL
jgi:hypothetical protein